MTVLDPRPWSPASAHIGPDDDDLAMLIPTGDPEIDLGSALLALHRVGAAACEAVARAPLPDEYRLIEALATARAAVAEPAVSAVSKCVTSENPLGYADLLLRDVLDAGEAGALAIYRSCVAKGVAPPLAAQRAGLVYGVPHNELGRYLSVAADPKAHPIAIADAADRAVTHWAADIVRAENAQLVSKAVKETVQEYNATAFGQEHPKGSRGRFVEVMERESAPVAGEVSGRPAGFLARLRRDTGIGGQAAPEVEGLEVTAPVTAPPAPRVQRVQRVQRTQRTQSGAPTQATVRTSVRARLKAGVDAYVSAPLAAAMNAQRNAPTGEDGLDDDDYTEPGDVAFGVIPNIPLAWAMPANRAQQLYHSMQGGGTSKAPKHTQVGNLQARLAEPMRWEHRDHQDTLQDIAESAAGDELPRATLITEHELEAAGVSQLGTPEEVRARVLEHAEMMGYTSMVARDEAGTLDPIRKGMVAVLPSADKGRDWYVVSKPMSQVHGDLNVALPMAAEFVVVGDRIRGNIEGGPDARQPFYELDPSQTMVVHGRKEVWRATGPGTGFFIDRYTVEPMDEWREETQSGEFGMRWIGKVDAAVATQQRWRTEPRNDAGEWTRGGFLARVKPVEAPTRVEPVVTPIRMQRVQRGQRRQTAGALVETGVNAGVDAKVRARIPARLDAALRAVFAEQEEKPPKSEGFPATLDDRPIHRVMSRTEWAAFLLKYAPTSYADDVRGIDLPGAARLAFAEGGRGNAGPMALRDDREANSKLRVNLIRAINEDPENRLVEVPSFRRRIGANDHDSLQRLRDEITAYMESHPHVAQAQIEADQLGSDWEVTVHVNAKPVPDQVLIYTDDDIDWNRPVSLVWVGKRNQQLLNQGREMYYDRGNVVNAPVSVYRAQQRTWRAHQDER